MKSPRAPSVLRAFLESEAAGGILLIAAAALALIVSNSAYGPWYHEALHRPLGPVLTPKLGPMTAHLWINDGLMAVFFFLIGLEIKRELVDGHLATWKERRLPFAAAAGGMIVPAAVYLGLVGFDPLLVEGWAIPAATDIAFALGVLALLGSRAPASLKLFLTTVAIVDDMGAVAIIALAYTPGLNTLALGAAGGILLAMQIMNRSGVRSIPIYLVAASALWYAVLLSGVHATVAGVLAALAIPIVKTPGTPEAKNSPLHRLEHALVRPVAFIVVPVFGFANAGVTLGGIGVEDLVAPLPLAVSLGLLAGKQIGTFGAVALCVRLGLAERPFGASWLQVYGVSLLCGIGFTMSLFIGGLAFPGSLELQDEAKLGILLGSLVSAIGGYVVLRAAAAKRTIQREPEEGLV